MLGRKLLITLLVVGAGIGAMSLLSQSDPTTSPAAAYQQLGKIDKLQSAYLRWAEAHEAAGGDANVQLTVAYSKGLSKDFSLARGRVKLDLLHGDVSVNIDNPEGLELGEVWIVDNVPGPGRSVMPEPGDIFHCVGTLERDGDSASLVANVGDVFQDIEVDQVVVTLEGASPEERGVLYGSLRLYQRLYTRARMGRLDDGDEPNALASFLGSSTAYADDVFPTTDALVAEGADLFLEEDFDGNGRTCGSCHPAENNFTIDPEFIATLKDNDPLFVAEFVPALSENFEKPALMRALGLILENTNGMGDLANNFTMRGTPHTLGLPTSLTPAPGGADGSTTPPDQRTGWSGDGSPGNGTLREFAIGAVTQHFPQTLGRNPGSDFRLPTDNELDAMEAFQLFLGRDSDPDITNMVFDDPVVTLGRDLYITTDTAGGTVEAAKCQSCHRDGGANQITTGTNFNFDTGVEDMPNAPGQIWTDHVGDSTLADVKPDDGFGNPGNGTFNTPPVIEAADTGPFFHNHSVETLEGAIAFYNSDEFNNSPSGQFLAGIDSGGIGINISPTSVIAVSAFCRVLNALENIRSANEFADFATGVSNDHDAKSMARLAAADAEDALQVLDAGGLHPEAQRRLRQAHGRLRLAGAINHNGFRNALLNTALTRLQQAQDDMID